MKIFSSVTVNICRGVVLHFSRLYISTHLVTFSRMYKFKNCPKWRRQLLTITSTICQHLARTRLWIGKPEFRIRKHEKAPFYLVRYYYTTQYQKRPPQAYRKQKRGQCYKHCPTTTHFTNSFNTRLSAVASLAYHSRCCQPLHQSRLYRPLC